MPGKDLLDVEDVAEQGYPRWNQDDQYVSLQRVEGLVSIMMTIL